MRTASGMSWFKRIFRSRNHVDGGLRSSQEDPLDPSCFLGLFKSEQIDFFSQLIFEQWNPNPHTRKSSIEGRDREVIYKFFEELIRPPYGFDSDERPYTIITAKDNSGELIGAIAVESQVPNHNASDGYNLEICFLAVGPEYESRGLGRLLIGMGISAEIRRAKCVPKCINGTCREDRVDFYRAAGFDISINEQIPNGVMPLDFRPNVGDEFTCSFWKPWNEIGYKWLKQWPSQLGIPKPSMRYPS